MGPRAPKKSQHLRHGIVGRREQRRAVQSILSCGSLAGLRRVLGALFVIGSVGLAVELVFLEHFENGWMLLPLVAIGLGVVTLGLRIVVGSRLTIQLFRGVMCVMILTGLLGAALHYQAGAEFQADMESDVVCRPVALESSPHEGPADAGAWRPGAIGPPRSRLHLRLTRRPHRAGFDDRSPLMTRSRSLLFASTVLAIALFGAASRAQVGQGILDLNAVPESTLSTLPGFTPAIAKAFVAARPFATIVEANTLPVGQKLTPDQLSTLYGKAFVHLNLNTARRQEILLIPVAGTDVARVRGVPPVGVVGAVRQGDRQVRRCDGSRPAQAVCLHPD